MQPKTVSRYVETVETIAEDFVTRIRSIRDGQNEVPADFSNEMSKWALESIAYVALDQRLGLFTDTNPESDGQTLIKVRVKYFIVLVLNDRWIIILFLLERSRFLLPLFRYGGKAIAVEVLQDTQLSQDGQLPEFDHQVRINSIKIETVCKRFIFNNPSFHI